MTKYSVLCRALVGMLCAVPAAAQSPPCVSMDPSWTVTYPQGQIQMIGYNTSTQYMVATYRISPPTNRVFEAIPTQIANRLQYLSPSADAFFNANIAPIYHEALLSELRSNLCPIENENGTWLLTH